MSKRKPKIWFNVTTSQNWKRPPVGIVRVETNIYKEILAHYGNHEVIPCIWQDGEFIRLDIPEDIDSNIDGAISTFLPQTISYAPSYNHIYRFLEFFTKAKGNNTKRIIENYASENPISPQCGDILITMGLDWDKPFKDKLYKFKTLFGLKIISCCYDLIPVLYPQYCVSDVALYFKDYFYNIAWASDLVLCISKCTERDFLKFIKDNNIPPVKTQVIELGDNIINTTNIEQDSKAKNNLTEQEKSTQDSLNKLFAEEFIVFISTIERRKNHEVLYRAYHLLLSRGVKNLPKLVFIGFLDYGVSELMNDIALDPLIGDKIIRLNHLSDEQLAEVYQKALFTLFPSLYEGWGLPVGESLAAGQFVISSNCASLTEVGGDLISYLDPWNPEKWASEILKYVNDRKLLKQKKEKIVENYVPRTWKNTVNKLVPLIDDLRNTATKTKFVLEAGNYFKTLCGYKNGATVTSYGKQGYLLYGPYINLGKGKYKITINFTAQKALNSEIEINIVYAGNNKLIKQMNYNKQTPIGSFEFNDNFEVHHFAHNAEVQVKIEENVYISIETVTIEQL